LLKIIFTISPILLTTDIEVSEYDGQKPLVQFHYPLEMILTVLIGIRSANGRRSTGSRSCDGEEIGQALSLDPAAGRAAERAGSHKPAHGSGHGLGRRAGSGDDETVEVNSELKKLKFAMLRRPG
jgi:hypothetical protein